MRVLTLEAVVSMYLSSDLEAGATVIGTDYCDGHDVLVVQYQNGDLWHYLWADDVETYGEIAHTIECCRLPKGE